MKNEQFRNDNKTESYDLLGEQFIGKINDAIPRQEMADFMQNYASTVYPYKQENEQ